MAGYTIGVDVGGTNIVCGLVDPGGTVTARCKFSTAKTLGANAILEQIAAEARALVDREGLNWLDVDALGIGVPGLVDPIRGIAIENSNLGWKQVAVAELLGQLIGKPVTVDNDVRLYIYGEAVSGTGLNDEHVLGVTLGTGIASAFISNASIHYGSGYMAGEIGHTPVDGEQHLCLCGVRGCLETVVSAPGIARMAREAIERGEPSLLQRYGTSITAAEVAAACELGDHLALKVMEHAGRTLGKVLSFIVPALSPDVIVIGGGVAAAGEPLFNPLRKELFGRLQPYYRERLRIEQACLGDNAGVIGSATIARRNRN